MDEVACGGGLRRSTQMNSLYANGVFTGVVTSVTGVLGRQSISELDDVMTTYLDEQ